MRTLIVVALLLSWGEAVAQSVKPAKDWRTCDDGERACQAFCEQNKPGNRECTGDCYWRIGECRKTGYYPWGADRKNLVGPLTK
jgi:hypothetical protein